MLAHKNLLVAAKLVTAPSEQLKTAIADSEAFLSSNKSFEYGGKIHCPHGSTIKLVDISMDFDDIFKMLADKKTDIKGSGEIYIIWKADPIPPKDPPVVATTTETPTATPTVIPVTVINLMEGCE